MRKREERKKRINFLQQQGTIGSFNAKACLQQPQGSPGAALLSSSSCPVQNRCTMRKARRREQGEAISYCRAEKVLVLIGSSRKPEPSSAQGWSQPDVPQGEEAAPGWERETVTERS